MRRRQVYHRKALASKSRLPARKSRRSRRGLRLDRAAQQEILGLLLLALGGLGLFALLSATRGSPSASFSLYLRRIFGWGVYPVVLTLLAGGVLVLWRNLHAHVRMPWQRIVGLELLFVVALAISHLAAAPAAEGLALAKKGGGGGYIGWTLSFSLVEGIGTLPALVFLAFCGLIGLALILRLSLADVRPLWERLQRYFRRPPRAAKKQAPPAAPREQAKPLPKPAAPASVKPLKPAAPAPQPPARAQREPTPLKIQTAHSQHKPLAHRRRSLPAVTLLEAEPARDMDKTALEEQAKLIEETMASLGVPAQVVECRHGPTVTQFGVEPGYYKRGGELADMRVRVSQVSSLANDLALALAAPSIRIESPMPGRGLIGIEVPNRLPSAVTLRGVVETAAFADLKSPLKLALARDVSGAPVVVDLGRMPHLLVAGATGSGKSVCLNALISCLLLSHTPETLRLILVDPKRVEFTHFNQIPHLLGSVILEVSEAVAALKWVTQEMERRYRLFADAGARNMAAYNRRMLTTGESPLPYIIICIDEMAELMLTAPEEIERHICRIAQLSRATGIHLVIATQRPSVDVVTGLIKANFPARICFAVTSQIDSRVVLDTPGAERLLGKGDMLLMTPDSSKLVRAQGCLVSDAEIVRLTDFWKDKETAYLDILSESAPWASMTGEKADDLLEEATRLVRDHQQASVSYLQRRLRIGYPRAARLMDELEERGVVGPQVSGGLTRAVRGESVEG